MLETQSSREQWGAWLWHIAAAMCCLAATWLVFGQTRQFAFINFDDPGYIAHNPQVQAGWCRDSLRWAFTTLQEGHYHPLTWLSHMAAVEAFGTAPAAHHLINVALHGLNVVLLYGLLASATGQRVQALLAALLFAVHPLRAESVAWVTERKDVLSTAFWLLAMHAYLRFVRGRSALAWLSALACYGLGLLAKPMVITLPAALVLFDYWPLGRISTSSARELWGSLRRPLAEKAPFFLLALGSALLSLYGQQHAGALLSTSQEPLLQRLSNVGAGYLTYLGQWLAPAGSSLFHPLQPVAAGLGVGAWLSLAALTWLALRARERAPALLCGWLWFLGSLLPVIGFFQIGGQAHADRFMYIPSIGLGCALLFGGVAFVPTRALRRALPLTAAYLVLLAVWARAEVGHFADSERVWTHALATNADNFMAHNNLGVALDELGRSAESERHFREAVRLNPGYPPAQTNLGNALARKGDYQDAAQHFELALQRQPQLTQAQYNLGLTLARLGRRAEAEARYRQALQLTPNYAIAHYSLGALLVGRNQRDEGLSHLRRAAALEPKWQEPRSLLARLETAPTSSSP